MLRLLDGRVQTEFIWFVASSYDHGNEPPGFLKGGEFLDYLHEYQILEVLHSEKVIDIEWQLFYRLRYGRVDYADFTLLYVHRWQWSCVLCHTRAYV